MTDGHDAVNETELHAFVDDRLPPPRRAEVEAYLAAHPQEATRLQAYREQRTALHKRFDPVLGEGIPAELLSAWQRRPWQRWLQDYSSA